MIILTLLFFLFKYRVQILAYITNLSTLIQNYFNPVKIDTTKPPQDHVTRCLHHTHHQLNASKQFQSSIVSVELDFDKTSYIITVPVTCYITDPQSINNDNKVPYIDNSVKRMISDVNEGFNASFNDKTAVNKYIQFIKNVFSDSASTNARNYYLGRVNTMKTSKIQWNFELKTIIKKPLNLGITSDQTTRDKISKQCPPIGGDPMKELVVVIMTTPPDNGLLGISSFPFDDVDNKTRHQVNISCDVFNGKFPSYSKNFTFTHEFGHFFGLLHTFDNESFIYDSSMIQQGFNKINIDNNSPQEYTGDLIPDTTEQANPTYGKISSNPNNPYNYANYVNCVNDPSHGPNFYNIMDYSDDDQMFFFTEMQHRRMLYVVNKYYPTMLTITKTV